jgi:hypothetical protein
MLRIIVNSSRFAYLLFVPPWPTCFFRALNRPSLFCPNSTELIAVRLFYVRHFRHLSRAVFYVCQYCHLSRFPFCGELRRTRRAWISLFFTPPDVSICQHLAACSPSVPPAYQVVFHSFKTVALPIFLFGSRSVEIGAGLASLNCQGCFAMGCTVAVGGFVDLPCVDLSRLRKFVTKKKLGD